MRNFLTASAAQGNYTYGGQTVNVLALAAASSNSAVAGSSSLDPTVTALLNDIRAAAGTAGSIGTVDDNVNELRYNLATTSLRRFPTARIDLNVTDNHRFSTALNYNYYTDAPDTLNGYDPTFPGFPVQGGQTSIRLVLSNSLRSTLGRNLVNEARVGYSGAPVKFFDEMNVGMYTGSVANQNGRHLVFPSVGPALNHAGVNGPVPQSRNATDLTFDDNVTWLKGNHNLTGGISWSMFNVWLKNTSLVPRVSFGLLATDPATNVITSAALAAATGVTPSVDAAHRGPEPLRVPDGPRDADRRGRPDQRGDQPVRVRRASARSGRACRRGASSFRTRGAGSRTSRSTPASAIRRSCRSRRPTTSTRRRRSKTCADRRA